MGSLAFDVFWRDHGVSRGLQGLGKDAKTAEGRLGSLEKLGPKLTGAFAGLEVADFLKDSINSASNLNETVSKSQAIFGASSASVQKWAQGSATSMGLSTQAALENASSFGDMFRQIGFTQAKSIDLSESTVQLAADLGSFNNLGTDDVLERIAAGYRGEYDGLQKLIPNISAARVEQEALTLTHKASAKELTAQDKALAVNAILHKDGARAMGDFARTSSGAANQQRILAAEFENTKAEIGEQLLPVMMTLIHVGRDVGIPALEGVASVIGHIPTQAYVAAAGLVGITMAVKAGDKVLKSYREVADVAGAALKLFGLRSAGAAGDVEASVGRMGKLKGALGGVTGLLGGPWGLALTAAAVGVGIFVKGQVDAKQRVDELTASLDKNTGALTQQTVSMVSQKLQQEGILGIAEQFGVSLGDVTDAALGNADAIGRVRGQLAPFLAEQNRVRPVVGYATQAMSDQGSQAQRLMDAVGGSNAEIRAAVTAYHEQQTASRQVSAALKESTTATNTAAGAQRGAADATQTATAAQLRSAAALGTQSLSVQAASARWVASQRAVIEQEYVQTAVATRVIRGNEALGHGFHTVAGHIRDAGDALSGVAPRFSAVGHGFESTSAGVRDAGDQILRLSPNLSRTATAAQLLHQQVTATGHGFYTLGGVTRDAGDKILSTAHSSQALNVKLTSLRGNSAETIYSIRALAASAAYAAGAHREQGSTLKALLDEYPKYQATVLGAAGATSANKAETVKLTAAQVRQVKAAVTLQAATDALTTALDANRNATLQLRGGEAGWYSALAGVTDAVKQNGRTLDVHTEKGRANRQALDSLASSGLSYLGVIEQNEGVGKHFKRTLDVQWQALYAAARRFAATKGEARAYANQILATPRSLALKVTTPGLAAARAGARGLAADIAHINGRVVTVKYQADGKVLIQARGSTAIARAGGGRIPGWSPSKTADNVPVAATAGEHMWSVDEVKGAGGHGAVEQMRAAARAGALRLAAGGAVNRRVTANYAGSFPQGIMTDFIDRWAAGWTAGGGGGPVPGGSGVARWGPMVHRALGARGLPQSLWDNWMRQIATESGGNPNAVQGNIGDVNNRSGDLAKGLLQVIGATFRAFHVPGTSNNVFDAWANMNAAMNYAAHRYPNMEAVIGHGHGYARGTRHASPGWHWVGEDGPEFVRFRGGEQVMPASQAVRLPAGGGASKVTVNVTMNLDPSAHAFEDKVVGAINRAVRTARLSRVVLPGVRQ